MLSAAEIVKKLDLQPHPEGGYYRETYRSGLAVPAGVLPDFPNGRELATAIYFLLSAGQKSRLHRLRSDEQWHFYLGGPLLLHSISPAGVVKTVVLGADLEAGQELQSTVPAGYWLGAVPEVGTRFSLVGCTVAPGFDFTDLEFADSQKLRAICHPAPQSILDLV